MPRSPAFAGVILAAGDSSRMGSDKALLGWNGETFLSLAIRRLSTVCDFVIVVGGRNAETLRPLVYQNAGYLVINPQPEQGQFSSLKIALREVLDRGRDSAFITLVDRPASAVETFELLRDTFLHSRPAQTWAVVPEFKGKHGHPYIASREMIEAFLRAPQTSTAREVEHANQSKVLYVPVSDPNVAANLNTPEEFKAWKMEEEPQVSSRHSMPHRSSKAAAFIDSVLALEPQVIAFDCDGTLWSGDAGADFMYWEIEQKLLPDHTSQWLLARYKEYLAGKVSEDEMCGEMVQVHRGIPVAKIVAAAKRFFAEVVEHRIFPEMQELAHRLIAEGREVWAVSSTNDWVVIEGVKRFGIPAERVLAASVKSVDGVAAFELIQVPSDEGKRTALRKVLKRTLDASFGNSIHDVAMLELARHAFAINPNPDLKTIAQERSWMIYQPEIPR